jgi:hypothetical protein
MVSVVFARMLITTFMGREVSGPLPNISIRFGDPIKTTKSFILFVSLHMCCSDEMTKNLISGSFLDWEFFSCRKNLESYSFV